VQVAASALRTTGRLPKVSLDVAKLLAVTTPNKASLGYIRLHLDRYVAKAWQIEDSFRLCRPGQGYEEQGEVSGCFVGR
jgi:hypothetical protein